jgi:hypothetical protein
LGCRKAPIRKIPQGGESAILFTGSPAVDCMCLDSSPGEGVCRASNWDSLAALATHPDARRSVGSSRKIASWQLRHTSPSFSKIVSTSPSALSTDPRSLIVLGTGVRAAPVTYSADSPSFQATFTPASRFALDGPPICGDCIILGDCPSGSALAMARTSTWGRSSA